MREITERKNQEEGTHGISYWKQIAIIVLIIVSTIALGCLGINQLLGLSYKGQLLLSPCELCIELNPDLEACINPEAMPTDHREVLGIIINLSNYTWTNS